MILRKRDITDYYKKRNEISNEDAEKLFCSNAVLNLTDDRFTDGLKLSSYLLQEKLGAEKSWELIRKIVVVNSPTNLICTHIGTVLRRAYRDAIRSNDLSDSVVSRNDIARFIFKPLLEHCIMVQRKYAEKFCWILRGATFDRDEAMSKMLFDVSTPIVWRYLNAKNSHFRMGAYFVQCHVFPPSSDDTILSSDYFNKHCDAFVSALQDSVVDICLQAIEYVCEIVSMYYDQIPPEYVDKIFKELATLAEDESAKIRSTLYYGLRHFHECALGIVKFEVLLKKICKKGIEDTSEHVRCNVFRLLNAISDSRIKIISLDKNDNALLSIEDVMYSFDFEESEIIEAEISRLLFLNVFDRDMSNESRYKMLNLLCRVNRNAALDIHRLIYTYEIVDTTCILSHISSALTVSLRMLQTLNKKQADLTDKRMDKYDFEKYVEQGDEATFDENNETNTADSLEQLSKRIKNVVDCMVVCYATMRYDPAFDANSIEAQLVARSFSEIANDIITHFGTESDLLDTALSIITLVRHVGIHSSTIKHKCIKMLRSGVLNARYLEIFGLVAMDELLKLLQSGLDQLESLSSNSENGMKRKKSSQMNEFANRKVVIDALMSLLNLPTCNQYIIEEHLHYVSGFIDQLRRICDNFIDFLSQNKFIDQKLFFDCWKLWSVLMILKYNKHVFSDVDDDSTKQTNKEHSSKALITPQKSNRRSAVLLTEVKSAKVKDPLLIECDWMKAHLDANPELNRNADIIENFYQSIELHFQVYKHFKTSVNTALRQIREIHEAKSDYPRNRSINQPYQSCLKAGKNALEFAEPDAGIYQSIFEEEDEDID